ncbi:MAG: hypothetical protein KDK23_03470, partial [Leptospiraceae bacterium]|nr:hypothetical protein [Leptospiraceae bacterium]
MSHRKSQFWRLAPVVFLVLPSLLLAEGNQKLKMRFGTEIWPYYEMLDRQPAGPDSAGSDSEDTGFSLGRARVDMRGRFY